MDIAQLVEFTWNTISSGMYYDALKLTLGHSFERLTVFKTEDKKERFEDSLSGMLEANQDIFEAILRLASSNESVSISSIKTGNVNAGGNVIIGNNNSVGGNSAL